eukprot:365077-Chlamydomonas_euryale.AAC.13
MPVLGVARQRASSSGLGAARKGTPLRMVLSHPIPTPPHQPGRRTGYRATKDLSHHVECGLPTTPPRPTSPSAKELLRKYDLVVWDTIPSGTT